MKKTKERITAMLNAITFAESGEHETAAQYMDEATLPTTMSGGLSGTRSPEPKAESLRQRVERHFAASAYAEAGDFSSAEALLEVPDRQTTVLLAVEGDDPDPVSFDYAVSLCKRLDARMSVLLITDRETEQSRTDKVKAVYHQLKHGGIQGNVEAIQESPNNNLVDYTRDHKEIVTVVYDSPKTRPRSSKSKAWQRIASELSNKLSIPLITVLPTTR